jgi:general stress protein 26
MEVKLNTSNGTEIRQKIEHLLDQANQRDNWTTFATINENGYPDVREMGIILRNGLKVYLATARETCKVQQLKHDPKICLRAFTPQYAESVNYFGTAKLIEDENIKREFWVKCPDILAEYFQGPQDPGMVILELNPDYLDYVSQAQKGKENKVRLLLK